MTTTYSKNPAWGRCTTFSDCLDYGACHPELRRLATQYCSARALFLQKTEEWSDLLQKSNRSGDLLDMATSSAGGKGSMTLGMVELYRTNLTEWNQICRRVDQLCLEKTRLNREMDEIREEIGRKFPF